jgi:Ubiquinol-cytochrome C chaperone
MILKLFRRTPRDDSIARLYGTIVAQARAPAFYQLYGVPDTVNGRLEMIMLHTVLFLGRLEGETRPIRRFGQGLFDRFCRIWTTICAKWVWAILRCRGGCAGSARRFMAGKRRIGQH